MKTVIISGTKASMLYVTVFLFCVIARKRKVTEVNV